MNSRGIPVELAPNHHSGPNCTTSIARGRLNIELFEWGPGIHLPVRHRVHCATSKEREPINLVTAMYRMQQVEKCLLVHRLYGTSHVLVKLGKRLVSRASWTEEFFESLRKE